MGTVILVLENQPWWRDFISKKMNHWIRNQLDPRQFLCFSEGIGSFLAIGIQERASILRDAWKERDFSIVHEVKCARVKKAEHGIKTKILTEWDLVTVCQGRQGRTGIRNSTCLIKTKTKEYKKD